MVKWKLFSKERPKKDGTYAYSNGKHWRSAYWGDDSFGDKEFSDNGDPLMDPKWWAKINPPEE